MHFRSNLVPVMVRYQLRVMLEYIFLSVKFYGALKKTPKSVNVFHSLLSIKIQICVYCVHWWTYHLVDSRNPLWIRGLLSRTNSLVSVPSRGHRVCFL